MREKARIPQSIKPLSPEEVRHRAFVASGKFDAVRQERTLNLEDPVVTRESSVIYRLVRIVRSEVNKGDKAVIKRTSEDGNSLHGRTLNLSDVCHAEDYEKALREQSQ